ncbi:MAG: HAD-IA family hydrolase [Chloroflexota bacterium]
MNQITTLIFDIGGVIFRAAGGPPLREKWAAKCGLDFQTFDEIVFNSPLYDKAAIGEISSEEVWADRNTKLGLSENDLQELKAEYYHGRWDLDLMENIQALAPYYKLGIISDATSGTRERVSQNIDISLFQSVIFSYEAGVRKPDPKIYHQSLRELDIPAQEALFIDDRQINIDGAEAVGMLGYLYEELRPFQDFMLTIAKPK